MPRMLCTDKGDPHLYETKLDDDGKALVMICHRCGARA